MPQPINERIHSKNRPENQKNDERDDKIAHFWRYGFIFGTKRVLANLHET